MTIKLELNKMEVLVVLASLYEFVSHPHHPKDKDLAEKVRLDILKAERQAFNKENVI